MKDYTQGLTKQKADKKPLKYLILCMVYYGTIWNMTTKTKAGFIIVIIYKVIAINKF